MTTTVCRAATRACAARTWPRSERPAKPCKTFGVSVTSSGYPLPPQGRRPQDNSRSPAYLRDGACARRGAVPATAHPLQVGYAVPTWRRVPGRYRSGRTSPPGSPSPVAEMDGGHGDDDRREHLPGREAAGEDALVGARGVRCGQVVAQRPPAAAERVSPNVCTMPPRTITVAANQMLAPAAAGVDQAGGPAQTGTPGGPPAAGTVLTLRLRVPGGPRSSPC